MDLTHRLNLIAQTQPNKPAFIFYSARAKQWASLTFAQLADLTHRFMFALQACPLTPGMRAAVMTPPSVEFFALALAMLKLGIIPIIVDPAIGLKKVSECLKESRPDIFMGNALTHALRILFGWGKESLKHNLTINKLLRLTNYQVPSANLQSPTLPPPSYTPVEAQEPQKVCYIPMPTSLPSLRC